MRPIATRTRCHVVRLSVCVSVTLVYPAKTAEPIEMPFCMSARVGPSNHVLDWGPDLPGEGAILEVGKHGHGLGRYIQQDDAAFYRNSSTSCFYRATLC